MFNLFTKFVEHGHGHGHDHSHGKRSPLVNDNTAAINELLVHPAASRQSIVNAAQETILEVEEAETAEATEAEGITAEPSSDNEDVNGGSPQSVEVDINKQKKPSTDDHHHHDHKTQNLNMKGVFIHVLGDALGNVGVILTGLFIYYTDYSWRFYADPAIRYHFFYNNLY
jgi:zinc transporter 1